MLRVWGLFCLLVVAGCAAPELYGAAPALSPASSNLSTMRQMTGRAEGLEPLRPEPGDIWAAEHPAEPPSTPLRSLRATASRREAPLTPPPLSHAEGNFWQMPELGPRPRT